MSGERGVATSELTGRATVTGAVGISVDTPTPTVVTRGTVGSTGAGKRDEVEVNGTFAIRTYPTGELIYDGGERTKGEGE